MALAVDLVAVGCVTSLGRPAGHSMGMRPGTRARSTQTLELRKALCTAREGALRAYLPDQGCPMVCHLTRVGILCHVTLRPMPSR
jgi:hypothetical protein